MQFSVAFAAFTFAAVATANAGCGINGGLCERSVGSVGFTAKAREWMRTRGVEAPKEAREAVEVEVTI